MSLIPLALPRLCSSANYFTVSFFSFFPVVCQVAFLFCSHVPWIGRCAANVLPCLVVFSRSLAPFDARGACCLWEVAAGVGRRRCCSGERRTKSGWSRPSLYLPTPEMRSRNRRRLRNWPSLSLSPFPRQGERPSPFSPPDSICVYTTLHRYRPLQPRPPSAGSAPAASCLRLLIVCHAVSGFEALLGFGFGLGHAF